jgi:predicted PolB exonuclease-like 3'-5' exonuclease
MKDKDSIFVFDIETIPDDIAAINLVDGALETLEQRREALIQYHLDITEGKNSFLRQPFHKVVAISYLVAKLKQNEDGTFYFKLQHLRSAGDEKSTEQDLVKGFFEAITKLGPQIVSFNGKTFDIPVLKYRAMKYGISGGYFNAGTKWDNYAKDPSWHCDLLEVLSDFGKSAKIKLNEVCSIFGYPGKFGVDGSLVSQMFDEGKIKDIRDYCETDVLNTFLVYLRYCMFVGKIDKEGYNLSINSILEFLENNQEEPWLGFYNAWSKSCLGDFYL